MADIVTDEQVEAQDSLFGIGFTEAELIAGDRQINADKASGAYDARRDAASISHELNFGGRA
nr:hypothetical protein [Variovorax paradoxus]